MLGHFHKRPRSRRFLPRLEALEARRCPATLPLAAPVMDQALVAPAQTTTTADQGGTTQNQATTDQSTQATPTTTTSSQPADGGTTFNDQGGTAAATFSVDPARNNVVSQVNAGPTQQFTGVGPFDRSDRFNGRGDINQFGQVSEFGRTNLNDNAATAIPERELQSFSGTPDHVRRFLLLIDPMTPVESIPQDVASPYPPTPTTNVRNVGPNMLVRATANRIGGAGGDVDLPPPPNAAPDTTPVTPAATNPAERDRPAITNPGQEEEEAEPPRPQEAPRQEESRRLAPLPPQENPSDAVGQVFGRFVAPVSPTFHGVDVLAFAAVEPVAAPAAGGE